MATCRERMTPEELEKLAVNLARDEAIRHRFCETCGADNGEPCFTQSGALATNYHVGRK
jgi:hypothetical protein